MASAENLTPTVIRRLSKEFAQLTAEPPEGIKVLVNLDNMTDVQAWIQGPEGTPYQGGCFKVKLVLGSDFPNAPPKGFFLTKIFHPNVSKMGEICVNVLKKDWKKDMGIGHILLTIKCLLIDPNPESALNEEAGKLLLEDYNSYAKHAKLITSIHGVNRNVQFGKAKSQENGQIADEKEKGKSGDKGKAIDGATVAANGTVAGNGAQPKAVESAEVLGVNNGGTMSPKKRVAEKKLEMAKVDKKRTLRRL